MHDVSTRKVDDVLKALGVDRISKSEVSRSVARSTRWWPPSAPAR